jgi:hypothetical protein
LISRRWLLLGTYALVAGQILIWLVAGSIVWSFRSLVVGAGSIQEANNAGFAVAIFVGAAVNAIAFLAFLLRKNGSGWLVLIAVQIADVAVTAAEGALVSPWWWLIGMFAGVTIALLYLLRPTPA